MKNTITGKPRGGEKYIRLGSLMLMLIFTVGSFAVMWTAVGSFRRINSAYDSASEGLAAAQFTANHIRRAAGDITVYSLPDGRLEKMIISRNDGYENIVYAGSGVISEALVPRGMETSSGQEIFDTSGITLTPAERFPNVIKITAWDSSGSFCTVFARTEEKITFITSEAGEGE